MASDALNVLFKLYKRYYFKKHGKLVLTINLKYLQTVIAIVMVVISFGFSILYFFCKMLLQYAHPVSFQIEYGEKMSFRRYQYYVSDRFSIIYELLDYVYQYRIFHTSLTKQSQIYCGKIILYSCIRQHIFKTITCYVFI